jgi:hypothetical protein
VPVCETIKSLVMKTTHFKHIGKLFVTILLSILSYSCKKDQAPVNGHGHLVLNIQKNMEATMQVNTLRSVPLEEYAVTILKSTHEIYLEYEHYSLVPHEILLEAGEYYIVAHSNNDSSAAFENPYFRGQSGIFSIGNNKISQVDVVCEVGNFAVKIEYSEEVQGRYQDYYAVVKNKDDSLVFGATEKRLGYFALAPLEMYAVLTYPLTGGGTATETITGAIASPAIGNVYVVTVDASYDEAATSILVSIDESYDTLHVGLTDYLRVNDLAQGDLLITEIMFDPSALPDGIGEWFEIYNNTRKPVNIMDLVLVSGRDDFIVDEKIILQSGESFVFACSDTAVNVKKFVYTGFGLTNTADDISIFSYGTNGKDGTLLATVSYDKTTFPNTPGASISLSQNLYDYHSAMLGTSWCIVAETYNTGDRGTPGSRNPVCE